MASARTLVCVPLTDPYSDNGCEIRIKEVIYDARVHDVQMDETNMAQIDVTNMAPESSSAHSLYAPPLKKTCHTGVNSHQENLPLS